MHIMCTRKKLNDMEKGLRICFLKLPKFMLLCKSYNVNKLKHIQTDILLFVSSY